MKFQNVSIYVDPMDSPISLYKHTISSGTISPDVQQTGKSWIGECYVYGGARNRVLIHMAGTLKEDGASIIRKSSPLTSTRPPKCGKASSFVIQISTSPKARPFDHSRGSSSSLSISCKTRTNNCPED
jgi:hypothetical protein